MTQTNNLDVTKKLSLESKQLLDELGTITTKAADLVPRLYKSLEKDGLGNSEIFAIIKEKIDISRARLYELIPPESKRSYKKVHKLDNSIRKKLPNQTRLVVPEEPTIPPQTAAFLEAEIVPHEQPAKTITDKQTFILDPKTCKGWPCDKVYIYEVECKDGVAIRMYSI